MYEQEKSEIQILKTYLQTQIPTTPLPPNDILLSSNSIALKAAIAGLDKELSRLEREERLVKKFTAEQTQSAVTGRVVVGGDGKGNKLLVDDDADMEYVQMTKEDAAKDDVAMDDDDKKDEDEWEDAKLAASPAKKQHLHNEKPSEEDNEAVEVCQQLASNAVARIANANGKVSTPLGALALALHTALVELEDEKNKDQVFRCTGVPDANVTCQFLGVQSKGSGGGGGFAPPVRELPRGQLVPPKWENDASDGHVIAFRYKCGKEVYSTDSGPKNDATTVYLTLQQETDGEEVTVMFGTLPKDKKSSSESRKNLHFPLGQHINLDGFTAAKTKNGGGSSTLVSPSLFYISLHELLFKFHSSFGVLIPVVPKASAAAMDVPMEAPAGAHQSLPSMPPPSAKPNVDGLNVSRPNIPPDGPAVGIPPNDHSDPLRVLDSQRGRHGDFEGDLLPGGPQPGGLHGPPGRGGSQVGPNHPMFDRTFGEDNGGYGYDDEFGGGFGEGGGSFGISGVEGMGMRPRFDPYGPPGGPTEPGRGRGGRFPGRGSRLGRGGRGGRGGRMPPGGFGNPNPDHMQPPGGGYFS